ncbi:3-isopropylmalate dehydratase large subunit [Chloroflexota bacterium]
MGKTLAEKILSEKSGRDANAGEIILVDVDFTFTQDITAQVTFDQFKAADFKQIAHPEKCAIFIGQCAPAHSFGWANIDLASRDFAREMGVKLWDTGEGLCHQIIVENYANPGDIIIGADSHTCMSGALGTFAAGVGSTDTAVIMGLGQTWLRVPESIKVELTGSFPKGVYAKDLVLKIAGIIGSEGASYKVIEFRGEAVARLTMDDRLGLTNIGVAMGAKASIFPSDEITKKYLEEQGRGEKYRPLEADDDAEYCRIIHINLSELEPMVSKPHLVFNAVPIGEVVGTKVQQVAIGTCQNGRFEDLKVAAEFLKGKKRHPDTRLVIAPASRQILAKVLEAGYFNTFFEAGAMVLPPSCGACAGDVQAAIGDGEVCLSTAARNFKGRLGNPNAFIYLASPATAAVTAIRGEITDPREVL